MQFLCPAVRLIANCSRTWQYDGNSGTSGNLFSNFVPRWSRASWPIHHAGSLNDYPNNGFMTVHQSFIRHRQAKNNSWLELGARAIKTDEAHADIGTKNTLSVKSYRRRRNVAAKSSLISLAIFHNDREQPAPAKRPVITHFTNGDLQNYGTNARKTFTVSMR